jgi:hypothetical protein
MNNLIFTDEFITLKKAQTKLCSLDNTQFMVLRAGFFRCISLNAAFKDCYTKLISINTVRLFMVKSKITFLNASSSCVV